MGRAKKIYEWLRDIIWIILIGPKQSRSYIKINEKININLSTEELEFYPQITYKIGTKVKVYVPINDAWMFGCAEFTGIVLGSYISATKRGLSNTDNDVTYLIYAEYYELAGYRKYMNKIFQINSRLYTICGIKNAKKEKKIHTIKDMYRDIKTFCNNSCILSDECNEDCPFYRYEANKSRKKHLS